MTKKTKNDDKVVRLLPKPKKDEPGEFELEHWQSRARVAEAELDSAKNVIAALRQYFIELEIPAGQVGSALMKRQALRQKLREHDQKYWTRDDATRALAEGIVDIKEGRLPGQDE